MKGPCGFWPFYTVGAIRVRSQRLFAIEILSGRRFGAREWSIVASRLVRIIERYDSGPR